MWYRSPYLPHVLYSLATTTISIHLIGTRTTCSEERARINAQISILENMAQRLQSNESISDHELERLKTLARPAEKATLDAGPQEVIRWGDILWGQKKAGGQPEMSKWDTKDVETGGSSFTSYNLAEVVLIVYFFFDKKRWQSNVSADASRPFEHTLYGNYKWSGETVPADMEPCIVVYENFFVNFPL